ncbi:MBL fold metallo-hydrolase [Fulvivirga ulvae]|uniref:MBL fold metallo-hydrolase n=1 Tax=Fulvivirga ulvae TaxID=2904245 RepID=UPI001F29C4B0|nr:MBL fold metallo-hydrolase [Fulvivirga ulvae]UII31866.1 MBL fold metallo-hydrolase [Fulvivirga ulvae]
MDKVYLKPNVVIEPLIDNWYAWSHLISPATAAMNIKNRHMEIMESYAESPELHEMAVANPALLGGPFIDYPERRVEDIKNLITQTKKERAKMFELANALVELDKMLLSSAKGFSLQDLYKQVPEILKGYVELVYDLNNQPSYRLIEPLLFKSEFYDDSAQSLMMSLIDKDDRPFVMSTPRLEDDKSVELKMPFNSALIDELFEMKTTPRPLQEILDKIGMQNGKAELFKSFFTTEKPPVYESYKGDSIRWRYFGHACILIEANGFNVLFDPVLSYTYESDISRYTYEDLPDQIDYVVITHNHQDHILIETLLQIRHKVKNIVVPKSGGGALQDPSLKLTLSYLGFNNTIELDELESISTPTGTLTAIPFFGEHADLNIRTKAAWLIEINKKKIMLAADSCNLEPALYEHVQKIYGHIDVLFLGMECDGAPLSWLYGPLLSKSLPSDMDKSRRLAGSNYERGIDIVDRFDCKEVYVYAMGQEPWLNHVMAVKYTEDSNPIIASNKLLEVCKEKGRVAERLFGEKELELK